MKDIVKGMEDKYGFPQAFGCVDGTHIAINQPTENPHDYFSYKQKYTLNVPAVCDWRGQFPSTSPQGGLHLGGDLTDFTSLGGLYLEGLIHGGAYFRNFTVFFS